MTPLFPNSNLQTDSYNNEIDQTDIEFNSYNECENDEDIESIDEEYMEVESDEDEFQFDKLNLEDLTNLEKLGENLLSQPEDPEKVLEESEAMGRVIKTHECYIDLLRTRSRTAKSWLQYQRYVNVLKSFIRAERTGNWSLPGHINYAKCARLHLQNMLHLEVEHPWVYEEFAAHGFHTIRRSDRFWAGIWSYLAIEQVLMRSFKSRGGLTRGRGVTESVRLIWLKTMHRCAEIHNSMSSLIKRLHVK